MSRDGAEDRVRCDGEELSQDARLCIFTLVRRERMSWIAEVGVRSSERMSRASTKTCTPGPRAFTGTVNKTWLVDWVHGRTMGSDALVRSWRAAFGREAGDNMGEVDDLDRARVIAVRQEGAWRV